MYEIKLTLELQTQIADEVKKIEQKLDAAVKTAREQAEADSTPFLGGPKMRAIFNIRSFKNEIWAKYTLLIDQSIDQGDLDKFILNTAILAQVFGSLQRYVPLHRPNYQLVVSEVWHYLLNQINEPRQHYFGMDILETYEREKAYLASTLFEAHKKMLQVIIQLGFGASLVETVELSKHKHYESVIDFITTTAKAYEKGEIASFGLTAHNLMWNKESKMYFAMKDKETETRFAVTPSEDLSSAPPALSFE